MTNFIYNNTKRKIQRRFMRQQMTKEELLLWNKLRNKQLGFLFRRQYSIGPYIVDFYCPKKRIVIEIDGQHHSHNKDYDSYRTNFLEALDITVVRFWNSEVRQDINKVVKKINLLFTPPLSRASSNPSYSRRGNPPSKVEGVRGSTVGGGIINNYD